jgi:integrase
MARPRKHDGVVYRRPGSQFWWMRYRDSSGRRHEEPTKTTDWKEAQQRLRERLQARDEHVLDVVRKGEHTTFREWAEWFLEHYSKPPMRRARTHECHQRAVKHLDQAFGDRMLTDLSADLIEAYLRHRLRSRVRRRTRGGMIEKGLLKATTVHQELRVLRRILNVAVRKRLLPSNPCWGVEFPVAVKGLFRPHYVSWSEQQRLEAEAPVYLRNVIRIITETGLRVYNELAPMKKDQVDIENRVVWIPDSKTPNGIGEVPLTELAQAAFEDQLRVAGEGPYLFPSYKGKRGHQVTFKTAWAATLRRAKVPHFRIYDLRSTYATRLSAGGVADEWVTQLLRQGDAQVFKKYSQMKLQMKREAHLKLNRSANEGGVLRQVG